MTQPSDTDRIIDAHRQEARKTRSLLAWLLIGIPVLSLIAWGIVAISLVSTSTTQPVASSCEPGTLPYTVDLNACPLSGPELTQDSSCSAYNADYSRPPSPSATNPTTYFISENVFFSYEGAVVAFEEQYAAHPGETLGDALRYEEANPPINR